MPVSKPIRAFYFNGAADLDSMAIIYQLDEVGLKRKNTFSTTIRK